MALPARQKAAWLPIALFLSLLGTSVRAEPQFPQLTGRVTDAANVIPPDVEARLTNKLERLETQKGYQLVVATIPSLGGYDIADYGYRLGRHWGIGSKERNDGALLIVAPQERELRIEVGYGLEGVLTDGLSSLIIQQTIVPRFKAGDLPGGIEAGTDAIVQQLGLPPDEARQAAQQSFRAPEPMMDTAWIENLVPLLFFGLIFLLNFGIPLIKTVRQRRRYPERAGVFIWDLLANMPKGRSGSSGRSSGGFSGGGGSFGGGGASGRW